MKIKRDGIYKTIDSKDFGIFQKSGWIKVVAEPIEEVKPKKVKPEPIEEIANEQPIVEQEEEIVMPKSKKKNK